LDSYARYGTKTVSQTVIKNKGGSCYITLVLDCVLSPYSFNIIAEVAVKEALDGLDDPNTDCNSVAA